MRSADIRPHLTVDLANPKHVAVLNRLFRFATALTAAVHAVDPAVREPYPAVAEALCMLGDTGSAMPQLAPGEYFGIAIWAQEAAERTAQEAE